ncbi:MAG: hypothetical protein U0271_26510 [Polyangiaceae bacterium]
MKSCISPATARTLGSVALLLTGGMTWGCAVERPAQSADVEAPKQRWVVKLPVRPATPPLPENPVSDAETTDPAVPESIDARALAADVELIALPTLTGISAVTAGRSGTMLAATIDGTLLEVSGRKAKVLGSSDCREFMPYWGPPPAPTIEPTILSIDVTDKGIDLEGYIVRFGRGSWNEGYSVHVTPSGKWKCHETGSPIGRASSVFGTEVFDAWAPAGETQVWYAVGNRPDSYSMEYNGIVWRRHPLPRDLTRVDALYADGAGSAWFAVRLGEQNTPALLYWSGTTYRYIPTPADFVVESMMSDGKRIWAFGPTRWFTIEGDVVSSMAAPMMAFAVYPVPGTHELWVGGWDPAKEVPTRNNEDSFAFQGMLAHVVAKGESAP